MLRPDRQSRFRPSLVTTDGSDADALTGLIMQPPSHDWPYDNDSGVRRAIAYLGSTDNRLGSDPRSSYWLQDWSEADTNAIIDRLRHADYPKEAADVTGAGQPLTDLRFTPADFETARSELIKEVGWVGRVRSYMNEVAKPFGDNALSDWDSAHRIADEIYTATHKPRDETVFQWLDFINILLKLGSPASAGVTSEIAAFMDMGIWIAGAEKGGTPTYRELSIKADALGDQLVERAKQTALTYDRMADIIVSDPAKLAIFGKNAGCAPSAGDKCPPEFAWDSGMQLRAAANVYRGVERLLYEKLLPLGYHVFQLTPKGKDGFQGTRTSPPDVHDYRCQDWYHPWFGFPALASTSLSNAIDPTLGTTVYETLVLAQPPGASDQHGTPPPTDMLERMFDPVLNLNNPRKGGLGMLPGELMGNAKKHFWENYEAGEKNVCGWDK